MKERERDSQRNERERGIVKGMKERERDSQRNEREREG